LGFGVFRMFLDPVDGVAGIGDFPHLPTKSCREIGHPPALRYLHFGTEWRPA
jgi:hypothetical protein